MSSIDATCASTNQLQLTPLVSSIEPLQSEYIPFCLDEFKPTIGQNFKTLDVGVDFYRVYAKVCGFTARLGTTKRIDAETFQLRNVYCNREGSKREKKRKVDSVYGSEAESNESSVTRSRLITRVNCSAKIQFKRQMNGSYTVTRFYEGHSHPLASPDSAIFLKKQEYDLYSEDFCN
jgi:hypothetical protein